MKCASNSSRAIAANAAAFESNARGRWQADLYELARRELRRLGVGRLSMAVVSAVYADATRFFSYRREPADRPNGDDGVARA